MLFGKPYITQYDPIRNAQGQVIGLSFIGLDYSDWRAGIVVSRAVMSPMAFATSAPPASSAT